MTVPENVNPASAPEFDFDILDVSDLRLPGGTSHSIAEEVRIQSAAGLSTCLVHIPSMIIRRRLEWAPAIRAILSLPDVHIAPPARPVRGRVLILRHPKVAERLDRLPKNLRADKILVIANHAAADLDGHENYDVEIINENLQQAYGARPVWLPIGPIVRRTLVPHDDILDLSPTDWVNVLSQSGNFDRRSGIRGSRPRIGRHSRPQPSKWPDRARVIRDAYPMDDEFDVRILGGAQAAVAVLGKTPSNWTVYEFGTLQPDHFLAEIDFWVYFHHPNLLEAFGRAIIEALRAGCIVVLPRYLEATYGDAAVYCEPEDVRDVVRSLASDPQAFAAQSKRGQDFAATLSAETHLRRLAELGVTSETDGRPETRSAPSMRRRRETSVLFISSNGAGMGHLTRLLAIARATRKPIKPIFLTLSQGAPVVGRAGYPFEYVPSNGAMGIGAPQWNRYFITRLEDALSRFDPSAIVFDGTVPYAGLTTVLKNKPLLRVWIRRAMWKAGSPTAALGRAQFFDTVVEPGEYASEYDAGPTQDLPGVVKVNPVSILTGEEMLPADQARESLGLEPGRPSALVTLGAGSINAIDDLQSTVIHTLRGLPEPWEIFLTRPPIAAASHRDDVHVISTYPLARLARGFDIAVSASGYNTYHELLAAAVPTVWIPNDNTAIDDQVARARFAQDAGMGLSVVEPSEDLPAAITKLADPQVRVAMSEAMASLPTATGAQQIADLLMEVL